MAFATGGEAPVPRAPPERMPADHDLGFGLDERPVRDGELHSLPNTSFNEPYISGLLEFAGTVFAANSCTRPNRYRSLSRLSRRKPRAEIDNCCGAIARCEKNWTRQTRNQLTGLRVLNLIWRITRPLDQSV